MTDQPTVDTITPDQLADLIADAEAFRNQPALRDCLLPGCLRQFDMNATMRGRTAEPNRSAEGWKQVRPTVATGYICPDHAPLMDQHRPRWAERTDQGAVLACGCGWGSPAARWPGYAVAAWQNHLIGAAEAVAPGPAIPPGGNAEDCPRCEGTNPPYPFLCPGHPAQEA